jgi:hypothetical protein
MTLFSKSVQKLFSSQIAGWELARINYGLLSKVRSREIGFGAFRIKVQYNPERIRSSSAKVDSKSIETRPCFLCRENRPSEQRGVNFKSEYTILINPFPIFSEHLTIASDQHVDQRIKNSFADMLNLARVLTGFVIFYNGPQCGASAPDHLHFQAGNLGFMPIEKDFSGGKFTTLVSSRKVIEVYHWKGYMRGIITLKGTDHTELVQAFHNFYSRFSDIQPDRPEPMMNILAYYFPDGWMIHIIPRILHRPCQFFAPADEQLLLSPASVDLGGVFITPREEDFNKIKVSDIESIFGQVCMDEEEISRNFTDLL